MRLFFAVHLPPGHRRAVLETLRAARGLALRWVEEDSLHLTLKFLGECEPDLVDALAAEALVPAGTTAFTLTLAERVSGFPDLSSRSRVVHLPLQAGQAAIGRLADHLDAVAGGYGIARETRPFHAHLTLARVKQGPLDARTVMNLREVAMPPAVTASFPVAGFSLMASELRPQGAAYREVRAFALPPAAAVRPRSPHPQRDALVVAPSWRTPIE